MKRNLKKQKKVLKVRYLVIGIILLYFLITLFKFLEKKKKYDDVEFNMMLQTSIEDYLVKKGKLPYNVDSLHSSMKKLYEKEYIKDRLNNINLNIKIDSSESSFLILDKSIGNKEVLSNEFSFLDILFFNKNVILYSDSLNTRLYKKYYNNLFYKNGRSTSFEDTLLNSIRNMVKEFYIEELPDVNKALTNAFPDEKIKNKVILLLRHNDNGGYKVLYTDIDDLTIYNKLFNNVSDFLIKHYEFEESIITLTLPNVK